jgi:predicted transcriptional regulator
LQQLCRLLFELSNEDRLKIILELQKNPLKLSHISEKFGFTVPETARNISRLANAKLIFKDAEGLFHLTTLGEQAIRLLPGFSFLCHNEQYLLSRSLSGLPTDFVTGIGALVDSVFIKEITTSIFTIERVMREAQEYIWVLVDQLLASGVQISGEAISRGVELKKILPRSANIPKDILKLTSDPVFERGARTKKVESRYLDKVDVTILMSEKELALISFPNLSGKFDFIGFQSTNELALNWSKSLFSYYWNKAKP